jgi:hypothetical protein
MDDVIREGFGVIDVFRRYLADDDSIDQLSIALYGKRKYVFKDSLGSAYTTGTRAASLEFLR